MMQISNQGYPRMGKERELKKLLETHWQGKLSETDLLAGAAQIEQAHWKKQLNSGMDLIPVGDFSLYDQMLDTALMFGLVPARFQGIEGGAASLETYFAVARGNAGAPASAMKKWFDTNYHYIVPEWDVQPVLTYNAPLQAYQRAEKSLGIKGKPVILGPLTFVKLSKNLPDWQKSLSELVPVYIKMLQELVTAGVSWVQLDEPVLVLDLTKAEITALQQVYQEINKALPGLKIMLQTYFGGISYYQELISLPVAGIGLDFVQGRQQNMLNLEQYRFPVDKYLAVGIINGRNLWQADLRRCLDLIKNIESYVPAEKMWLQPSCSLLHLPVTTAAETHLPVALRETLRFADERLTELNILGQAVNKGLIVAETGLAESDRTLQAYQQMPGQTEPAVRERVISLRGEDFRRAMPFAGRKEQQDQRLALPVLPTTTIGSFPQTPAVRQMRARFKKGQVDEKQYQQFIQDKTAECIKLQADIGLDVLVHGEFERNDMVEFFGEKLQGFAVTVNGWVQSYGSRCVKPPILYGDVWRDKPMTVANITYAQSLTKRPVKGMLTGPITIINWSFVREDLGQDQVAYQLGLALRDEIQELEEKGIAVIQVDDPALREGLPLKKQEWGYYLAWTVNAFKLATGGVRPDTQIHTHMCYCEFKDIMQAIDDMDADVISVETSRAGGDVIGYFAEQKYTRDIGLGVYDIHSPRIPETAEMEQVIRQVLELFDKQLLWVNPDCGLKTRKPAEVDAALRKMVEMTVKLRQEL